VAGASAAKVAGPEPGPGCETGVYMDTSVFRGFCFLGSGGWAFKQHVVPCVNPIL